ncbi:hypothetical protein ABE322_30110 [Priestia megaterium]
MFNSCSIHVTLKFNRWTVTATPSRLGLSYVYPSYINGIGYAPLYMALIIGCGHSYSEPY